ncbi:Protein ABHD13 [Coccomyxa sp. Obi]|nr:Protein ABHD13 [Coccomyxa sp. Obi]
MDWDSVMLWLTRALIGGGSISAVVLGLLYSFQERLIYIPKIPGIPNDFQYYPNDYGLDYEDVDLTAKDGTKLHAWYLHPRGWTLATRQQRPTVLFFQENAGNMSFRLPFLRLLARYLNCAIFAPSYRGYGRSQGQPNEAGIRLDAQAALDTLLQRTDVDKGMVVVMGKSLGGAVALHLAADNPSAFRAIVIENTFLSIEDVAPKMLPFLGPVLGRGKIGNFLIRNKWRNYEAIQKISNTPILMLSAGQDEIVPQSHMQTLYEELGGSKNSTCSWADFPEAHHNDTYEVAAPQYWQAMLAFFRQYVPIGEQ